MWCLCIAQIAMSFESVKTPELKQNILYHSPPTFSPENAKYEMQIVNAMSLFHGMSPAF